MLYYHRFPWGRCTRHLGWRRCCRHMLVTHNRIIIGETAPCFTAYGFNCSRIVDICDGQTAWSRDALTATKRCKTRRTMRWRQRRLTWRTKLFRRRKCIDYTCRHKRITNAAVARTKEQPHSWWILSFAKLMHSCSRLLVVKFS